MLRLLQCIEECGIPQKELVTATGWSKAQMSITLNSGRFPANADEFRADVTRFIINNDRIPGWLAANGVTITELFETAGELPAANERGEIAGAGPDWACGNYGQTGHDYHNCHFCGQKFQGYLQRARGRAIVTGGGQ